MTAELPDYEERFNESVREFWRVRDAQAAKQLSTGKADAGSRGSVTGGQHLHSLTSLIQQVFTDAGMPVPEVPGSRVLPGYYRAAKNWDAVIMYKGQIVAIIELKSHVGSFGNNQNNRIEEMVGQGLDIWRATREGLLGDMRPWFAYLLILEDHAGSRRTIRGRTNREFPLDPVFDRTNYLDRYRIAFERLRREGDMDAVCLLFSDPWKATIEYPDPTMTFNAFAAAIHGRVTEVLGMLGPGDQGVLLG